MNNNEKLLNVIRALEALTASLKDLAGSGDSPPDTGEKETNERTVTFEEVRKALAKVCSAGKADAAQALVKKYGGDRLRDVPPDQYADLLHDTEAL